MAAPEFNVQYVARLARLELTPEEEHKLGDQLGGILDYFAKLRELDVSALEPMAHAVPLANVTRTDAVSPSLPHADALRNAPARARGLFVVPKIIE
jgi:aspartyl-tRNA(Asn)/glutamyl-tRNA(Gln) amidotransferase subunit C